MYNLRLSQKIAFAGFFSALVVVFSLIRIDTPFMVVSFKYLPIFLAGTILGPIYGCAVGLVGDALGTLLRGYAIAPLIMAGNGLQGLIVGLAMMIKPIKNTHIKLLIGMFCSLLFVTYGVNAYALTIEPSTRAYFPTYAYSLSTRIVTQTPVVAVNAALTLMGYSALETGYLHKYRAKGKLTSKRNEDDGQNP